MELWKTISGLEKYEISTFGRVRNKKTKRILKLFSNKGYLGASLHDNSARGRTSYKIHRLVAKTFIGEPLHFSHVDHINRVKHDNRVENLKWVTIQQNNKNKINRVGIVEHIIELYLSGMSAEEIYKSL